MVRLSYVYILANSSVIVRYTGTSYRDVPFSSRIYFFYTLCGTVLLKYGRLFDALKIGHILRGLACSFPCTGGSETTVNCSPLRAPGEHRGALCFASCVEALAYRWVGLRCFVQKK